MENSMLPVSQTCLYETHLPDSTIPGGIRLEGGSDLSRFCQDHSLFWVCYGGDDCLVKLRADNDA